eukprot:GHVL01016595.1.p1 GENE.GHVL01016595.1~~GHVL01016595.1.p1  ORF type:complete len:1026 (+),score=140.03 GHVL01016595.1:141-3218(+)
MDSSNSSASAKKKDFKRVFSRPVPSFSNPNIADSSYSSRVSSHIVQTYHSESTVESAGPWDVEEHVRALSVLPRHRKSGLNIEQDDCRADNVYGETQDSDALNLNTIESVPSLSKSNDDTLSPTLNHQKSVSRACEEQLLAATDKRYFIDSMGDILTTEELQTVATPPNTQNSTGADGWLPVLQAARRRIDCLQDVLHIVDARVSSRVAGHYNEFVQGMAHIDQIEEEMLTTQILIGNSRRQLQCLSLHLPDICLDIVNKKKRIIRQKRVIQWLSQIQRLLQVEALARIHVDSNRFCQGINALTDVLVEVKASNKLNCFPAMRGFSDRIQLELRSVRQKLNDQLHHVAFLACVEELDIDLYEEVVRAYSLLPQSESLGMELCRNLGENVVLVTRQLLLSAGDYRKLNRDSTIKNMCGLISPDQILLTLSSVLEHLADVMYRFSFLCEWHAARAGSKAGNETEEETTFANYCKKIRVELMDGKQGLWNRMQQQVQDILSGFDLRADKTNEQTFLQIIELVNSLIEEGDAFMVDSPSRMRRSENTSQWRDGENPSVYNYSSDPLKNCVRIVSWEYFNTLHHDEMKKVLTLSLQDYWQRLPMPTNHIVIPWSISGYQKEEFLTLPTSLSRVGIESKNPFRLRRENIEAGLAQPPDRVLNTRSDGPEPYWKEDVETPRVFKYWLSSKWEQVTDEDLISTNQGPLLAAPSQTVATIINRYMCFGSALPLLAFDVFLAAAQILDVFLITVCRQFLSQEIYNLLVENPWVTEAGTSLLRKEEAWMVQRNRLTFKRAIVRIGGYMSNHTLDQEASEMLLLSKPRPQLTDSKEFHWASQRCIAAESLVTLVNALKGVSSRIKLLIPSNKCTYIDDWIEDWEKIVPEARNLIFEALAVDILDLKSFIEVVVAAKWENMDISLIDSPTDQLVIHIKDLFKRLECAGAGCIPMRIRSDLWMNVCEHVLKVCAECVCRLRCLGQNAIALAVLKNSFKKIQIILKSPADVSVIEELPYSDLLENYLNAHLMSFEEAFEW